MTEKNRINLAVSAKTKDRLNALQERIDSSSLSEVIRRSVELLDTVSAHQELGDVIVIKARDGSETELKVLF